jgi:hypothetical protein
MTDSPSQSGPPASRAELRRTPRINVRQRLRGHLVELDMAVVVRDISLGGFSVESDNALPTGVHIVRLQEDERWSVTVTAASRHRRSSRNPDGSSRHVMGFEYADQSPDTQRTLRILFERLAADQPAD